jgi:hypothetical protein
MDATQLQALAAQAQRAIRAFREARWANAQQRGDDDDITLYDAERVAQHHAEPGVKRLDR